MGRMVAADLSHGRSARITAYSYTCSPCWVISSPSPSCSSLTRRPRVQSMTLRMMKRTIMSSCPVFPFSAPAVPPMAWTKAISVQAWLTMGKRMDYGSRRGVWNEGCTRMVRQVCRTTAMIGAAVKNARRCGQDIVVEGRVCGPLLFSVTAWCPLMMLAITHIPVHQQTYLLFGVALRGHPRDEVLMFALIVGGTLLAERDYRQ